MPPHPGNNGLVGLLGVDTDGNGIRDDVEIAIYERHAADAETRHALGNLARSVQSAIAAVDSGDQTQQNIAAGALAIKSGCMVMRFGRSALESAFVSAATANTDERITAYLAFNDRQAGRSFRVPDFDAECGL